MSQTTSWKRGGVTATVCPDGTLEIYAPEQGRAMSPDIARQLTRFLAGHFFTGQLVVDEMDIQSGRLDGLSVDYSDEELAELAAAEIELVRQQTVPSGEITTTARPRRGRPPKAKP